MHFFINFYKFIYIIKKLIDIAMQDPHFKKEKIVSSLNKKTGNSSTLIIISIFKVFSLKLSLKNYFY